MSHNLQFDLYIISLVVKQNEKFTLTKRRNFLASSSPLAKEQNFHGLFNK